jgi:hypothetical protein
MEVHGRDHTLSCLHIQGVRREVSGCAPFKFLGREIDETRVAGVRANAVHDNPKIRAAAAASPACPADLLLKLAHDPVPEVREWVARNEKASDWVLGWLATDESPKVRAFVAWNKSAPKELVKFLTEDEDSAVRKLADTVLDNVA